MPPPVQQPGSWAGPSDPLVVVVGHLVSPQDDFGEIGRLPNGDLRRPNRLDIGVNGIHTLTEVVVTRFGGIPTFNGRRAEGTEAVSTAVLDNQVLARLAGLGFDGVALGTGGRIEVVAAENFAVGALGTRLSFSTTALGAAVLSERWQMLAPGHFVAVDDNAVDIGLVAGSRPRSGFFGTSVIAPLMQVTGDGGMEFTNQTDGAGVGAGTLTNAPTAGDPALWIPVEVNGSTHFIPAWT